MIRSTDLAEQVLKPNALQSTKEAPLPTPGSTSWTIFSTEFKRDFFTRRTVAIVAVFGFFTALIIAIVSGNIEEVVGDRPLTAETWTYTLGFTAISFFGGLVGITVASFLGSQMISRDASSGALRLLGSTPATRQSLYLSRFTNGVLQYLPLSFIAGAVVMTAGVVVGANAAGIPLRDFRSSYLLGVGAAVVVIFLVGFLAIGLANVLSLAMGSETQGTILSIMILVFGDLILSTLSALVPGLNLEVLSIGHHRAELYSFFVQRETVGGGFGASLGAETTAVAIPWLSVSAMIFLPIVLAFIGYWIYNRRDLP